MKVTVLWLALAATPVLAQHASESGPVNAGPVETHPGTKDGHAEPGSSHDDHGDQMLPWKWANFALLIGLLGYLGAKQATPYFRERIASIQGGLQAAAIAQQEAAARAAAVEQRMAALGSDVERLRATARQEMATEGERQRQETAAAVAKVHAQAQAEMANIAKTAQFALRREAAELALRLAEEQVRARLTPETQAALVTEFAQGLRQSGTARPQEIQ